MYIAGKIDKEIYKCITDNIISDEVIITDERIDHIKKRHPGDYENYVDYIADILDNPDYIIKDERSNTALVLKSIQNPEGENCFRVSLKLITSADDSQFKNSIITFMKTHKKEYERLLRNKKILYKRE